MTRDQLLSLALVLVTFFGLWEAHKDSHDALQVSARSADAAEQSASAAERSSEASEKANQISEKLLTLAAQRQQEDAVLLHFDQCILTNQTEPGGEVLVITSNGLQRYRTSETIQTFPNSIYRCTLRNVGALTATKFIMTVKYMVLRYQDDPGPYSAAVGKLQSFPIFAASVGANDRERLYFYFSDGDKRYPVRVMPGAEAAYATPLDAAGHLHTLDYSDDFAQVLSPQR